MTYTDLRLKFTDLSQIAAAWASLGDVDALGDWRDANGTVLAQPYDEAGNLIAAWRGGQGLAASSYTDPETNQSVTIPQTGDGSSWYVAIRTEADLSSFDPAQYGMTAVDPAESASVLGVWAGG